MMWPSGYRRCIFSGDISGSDLAVGFFFVVNFVHVFRYHFCSPLLVSVFLILLLIFVENTYSINKKIVLRLVFYTINKIVCHKVFSGL